MGVVLLWLGGMLSPGEALAQGSAPIVEIPRANEARLGEAWRDMLDASEGSTSETSAWERVRASAAELGLRQMPAHAFTLLVQAEEAGARGDLARARLLLDRAEVLGPDLARVAFADARLSWREQPWNLVRVLQNMREGWTRMAADPWGEAALHALGGRMLLELLSWILVALPWVWWLGRRRHAAMDLRTLTRGWWWPRQSSVVLGLLLITPTVLFWSPVLLLPAATILFIGQLRLGERILAAILIAGIPLAWPIAASIGEQARQTLDADPLMVRSVIEPCDSTCLQRLSRAEERDAELASTWRLVRAWVVFRDGTPEARRRAANLIEDLEVPPEARASLETLRGHFAYIQGDAASAEEHYRRALEAVTSTTDEAALLVNLFRVALLQERRDEATDLVAEVQLLSPMLTLLHLQEASHTQNRLLAAVPPEVIRRTEGQRLQATPSMAPAEIAPLFGRLSPDHALVWAGAGWLALMLGVPLRRRRISAEPCMTCGAPTSRALSEEPWRARRCLRCYGLENFPTRLDPDVRDAREAAVRRYQDLRPTFRLILAIFLPGFPQMAVGQIIRGFLPFLLMMTVLVLLGTSAHELDLPHLNGTLPFFDGRVVLALVLWLPAVTISTLSVWLEGEDEWMS